MTDSEHLARMVDVLENLLIGLALGWDLDGLIDAATTALTAYHVDR